MHLWRSDSSSSSSDEIESRMMVAVRARGLTERETRITQNRFPDKHEKDYYSVRCQHPNVILSDPDASDCLLIRSDRVYTFDNVFDQHATNEEVYEVTVAPLVDCIMAGYNATCFAYGMTGAGKTYTMMGEDNRVKGLCFLAMDDLFRQVLKDDSKYYSIHVSYLEIYNEKIKDLLFECVEKVEGGGCSGVLAGGKKDTKNLDIVEDAARGMVVNGLSDYVVNNLEDVQRLMQAGNRRRTMASTGSNIVSSRSHAILQITVTERSNGHTSHHHHFQKVCTGKLSLIDLAGSERASSGDHNSRGIRMVEGANINRSLLSLGNCITVLANAQQRSDKGQTGPTPHIPYRDSKLTRLLKDSLGGNTRTVMIANISPSCITYDETVSTLKYASRARNIRRKIHRNITEDTNVNCKEIISNLKGEIAELKEQVAAAQTVNAKLQAMTSPATRGIGKSNVLADITNSGPRNSKDNCTPKKRRKRKKTPTPSSPGDQTAKGQEGVQQQQLSPVRLATNGSSTTQQQQQQGGVASPSSCSILTEQQQRSLSQVKTVASYVNYLCANETDTPAVQQEQHICQMYLLCLLSSAASRRKEEQVGFGLLPATTERGIAVAQ